jgi:Mg2+/Co2+ transporter CorB
MDHMQHLFFETTYLATALAVFVLLLLSAFFSGAQTALTAASRSKLKSAADKGSRNAFAALKATEDPERMIGALLLATHMANTVAVALVTAWTVQHYDQASIAMASLVIIVLILVFGEGLPKTLAIIYPEKIATFVAPVVLVIIFVLSPIVRLARRFVQIFLRLFGVKADPNSKILALREEIVGAIAMGHFEGAVEKEDRDRLLGALDLGHRTVDEIMRHRRQIEMIDADNSPDKILTQVLASAHTRLPIFRDNEENIIGVIHAKDLLREVDGLLRGQDASAMGLQDLDIVKIAMKPYFIPETTALDEQMREFLKRRTHFALVVDEYGALQGLITLEDILEEIVGEISDEFDPVAREKAIKPAEDGSFSVDGAMTIRDLNRAADWRLPDEEANTIAGLVIHEAQMIPNEGQVFSFHNFRFEVVERRENRVTRLKIRPL